MMRDITIGQYYPVESPVHALDPRTKLMAVLLYIVSIFLVKNTWFYIGYLALLLIMFRLAKVPLSYFMKGLRNIIILLVFTFFFRMVATPGDVIATFWVFEVTTEGIHKAIHLTLRIALMVACASLLSYTSTPKQLADGMEKAFSPLEKIHIPVRDMAIMTMIAFRFIPVMLEEARSIMDAQAARGVEFENTTIWRKTRNVTAVVFPLFMNSIRRSADLAMAMEARGFSGGPSSKMYPLEYKRGDRIAYVLSFVMLAVSIVLRIVI